MRRSSASIAGVLARSGRQAWKYSWSLAAVLFLLGLLPDITDRAAEEKQGNDSQGHFLVARRELSDPLFEKSVVLMIPTKGTPLLVGLIVNRPTRVPLHDLFEDSPALQKRDATAYFGGPVDVEIGAQSALFRSKTPPKSAVPVFGDVYVSFDPDIIATLVADPEQASTLRVFLGRAQWAPIQLENEMTKGAWYSVRGSADSIFAKFPEAVWRSLLDQAEPRPVAQFEPWLLPLADLRL
jgi:putative transcriptional regulator